MHQYQFAMYASVFMNKCIIIFFPAHGTHGKGVLEREAIWGRKYKEVGEEAVKTGTGTGWERKGKWVREAG